MVKQHGEAVRKYVRLISISEDNVQCPTATAAAGAGAAVMIFFLPLLNSHFPLPPQSYQVDSY